MMLVDKLCTDGDALDAISTLSDHVKYALMTNKKFCELGAVSPDTPLADLTDLNRDAPRWGNVMHYWQTAEFIRRAIPCFFPEDPCEPDVQRAAAWLFGYTSHVVADLTVHPVIGLVVGAYEQHRAAHCACELEQDAYIFHEVFGDDIDTAEYIKRCGFATCVDPDDGKSLDPDVLTLWRHCLAQLPLADIKMKGGMPAPEHQPDPDEWFRVYALATNKVVEELGLLPRLYRRFTDAATLKFPKLGTLKYKHLADLPCPGGGKIHYRELFEMARANVAWAWGQLGDALEREDARLFTLPDGDLDTGLDAAGRSIFWSRP